MQEIAATDVAKAMSVKKERQERKENGLLKNTDASFSRTRSFGWSRNRTQLFQTEPTRDYQERLVDDV